SLLRLGGECNDEYVAMSGQGGIDRLDRGDAVRDAPIVDERRVERVGQREMAERAPVEGVDGGHAARDVAPVNQQDQYVIDAVAMNPFGGRLSVLAGARFDPELVHLDVPPGRVRCEAAEQRSA